MLSKLKTLSAYSLIIGVFTLPIYQTVNHWFFGLLIGSGLLSVFFERKTLYSLRTVIKPLVLFSGIFLVLRLVTLGYATDFNLGLKELVRALPFVLYPVAIFSIKFKNNFNFKELERTLFWALSLGCVITAVICWGNIILSLEPNAIPENRLFGWKKSGIYLTKILDLHPPYLGLLICASIIFLFKESYYNKQLSLKYKGVIYFLILFLLVFLFNLTARNTMFFLAISSIIFFIYNRQWKFLATIFLLFVVMIFAIIAHPSQYYRLKMYHMLGLSDQEDIEDRRFKRLEASYNVFKENPILGAGIGMDSKLKVEEYQKMNDSIAVNRRFNSHNQFFEYLAAYGLLGGSIFIIALSSFFYFLIKNRYYFYLLLFLNIVFATLTESLFERVLGIQYYSIIVSVVLLKHYSSEFRKVKLVNNED